MYIKRKIDAELTVWKNENGRKPLLVRGARQVGKTKSIREFGKTFSSFIEVNFEEFTALKVLFEGNLSPELICENLASVMGKEIIPGETLLFFDEIQVCPRAIASLRFFYEKMPDLHIIAAGSLLEFTLAELPTFGVGRIRSMFVYPLSFVEFLGGLNENKLTELMASARPENPLFEPVHMKLLEYFRKFLILGGMPAVIASYIENRNINNCIRILDDLHISFRADFAKYKKHTQTALLGDVFQSVVNQAGQKFSYSKVTSDTGSLQIKNALSLLVMAGLVYPVMHTAANGLPLGSEVNPKKQKIVMFDTGLFQRIMGLDLSEYLTSDNFTAVNKGFLAEQFTGLELIKSSSCYQPAELYYWHREAKSSNAEVDFVISHNFKIYPVEVKSGNKGAMKSMHLFMQEKLCAKGIRVSMENFSRYGAIDTYPLYAVSLLPVYLSQST